MSPVSFSVPAFSGDSGSDTACFSACELFRTSGRSGFSGFPQTGLFCSWDLPRWIRTENKKSFRWLLLKGNRHRIGSTGSGPVFPGSLNCSEIRNAISGERSGANKSQEIFEIRHRGTIIRNADILWNERFRRRRCVIGSLPLSPVLLVRTESGPIPPKQSGRFPGQLPGSDQRISVSASFCSMEEFRRPGGIRLLQAFFQNLKNFAPLQFFAAAIWKIAGIGCVKKNFFIGNSKLGQGGGQADFPNE